MQLELTFGFLRRSESRGQDWVEVGGRMIRLWFVPNRRARRYVLRLRPDGTARVTIPRGGSAGEARRFAARNAGWLERQLLRHALHTQPKPWVAGSELLFRGERVKLERVSNGEGWSLRLAEQAINARPDSGDLRRDIERHLWRLAKRELPPRVLELAAQHGLTVRKVMVRNQRSRWGSASRRGTISLNWRLVQAPETVCDYLIIHELAHLKEMNHSTRFWREVARMCPGYREAERWLKGNSELLR